MNWPNTSCIRTFPRRLFPRGQFPRLTVPGYFRKYSKKKVKRTGKTSEIWSGKCPVGEMSGRGMSGRGNVRS